VCSSDLTTRPKLEALWREVFIACGALAKDIKIHVAPSGARPNLYTEDEGGFPFVSAVAFDFGSRIPLIEDKSSLILPDVGFFADSSDFLDQEKAKSILSTYAEAIIQHLSKYPDTKLYLLGTSATVVPGGPGDIELSQQRADMLKEALAELNVPAARLISLGVGANVPAALRVNEFRNGRFDSTLAQANRKATIYEGDDEDFLEILAFNGIDITSLK
jgi:outer membrane protein OmpA-like peptidoglycan-associated protein